MSRNSPSIVNTGFMPRLMWDGRNASLEQQVLSSISASGSVNAGAKELGFTDADAGIRRIGEVPGYRLMFSLAYPGEPIDRPAIAKAIASFERSLVSRDTPFDRWVAGDAAALTPQQREGLRLFIDPAKGNCMACHTPPTFSDDRFHNLGLRQFGQPEADAGRLKEEPSLPQLRGAFRTPPLREVAHTPPYFHDGSARTLQDVLLHYLRGGEVRSNLSPLLKPAPLTGEEQAALLAFMRALSSPAAVVDPPRLPR